LSYATFLCQLNHLKSQMTIGNISNDGVFKKF